MLLFARVVNGGAGVTGAFLPPLLVSMNSPANRAGKRHDPRCRLHSAGPDSHPVVRSRFSQTRCRFPSSSQILYLSPLYLHPLLFALPLPLLHALPLLLSPSYFLHPFSSLLYEVTGRLGTTSTVPGSGR